MLDISRLELGKLELERTQVDLSDVLEGVLEQIRAVNVAELKIASDGPLIGNWDHFRLEQVILNLVNNAIKYGEGRPIEIRIFKEDNFAVLSVADQGIGIDKKNQDKIFQRFERAVSVREFSGLGLGLYITRQIVETHGGKIVVQSRVGQGATFTVRLPLTLN